MAREVFSVHKSPGVFRFGVLRLALVVFFGTIYQVAGVSGGPCPRTRGNEDYFARTPHETGKPESDEKPCREISPKILDRIGHKNGDTEDYADKARYHRNY